jgi:LPXTG-motif cell wall-anchored protein
MMTSKLMRTLLLAAAAAALLSVPAAAAQPPLTDVDPAVSALMARGLALDKTYDLGPYSRPTKQEARALELRGAALNTLYGLPRTKAPGASFEWGDAGIGSAATLGTLLLGLAAAVAFRRRRRSVAAA